MINKKGIHNNKPLIKELKTSLTAFEIFSIFSNDSNSFFLDSAMSVKDFGRYSFIGSNPFLIFKCKNASIEITKNTLVEKLSGDPFEQLKQIMRLYRNEYPSNIPFIGGGVGFFSYDLCHHTEKLPRTAIDDISVPDCYFGFYDTVIAIDHKNNEKHIISLGISNDANESIQILEERILNAENNNVYTKEYTVLKPLHGLVTGLKSNFSKEGYIRAIQKIKSYIKDGDIYQANLTQRFECELTHRDNGVNKKNTPFYSYKSLHFDLYERLRTINPAPFAAYLNFDVYTVISSSPERFIKINDRRIETRPIKGTRPRGMTPEEDLCNSEELIKSTKDKAELLMIVDLERNDIGKVSKIGSVKVDELFTLETYPTVFHLVSTIKSEVKDEYDEIDCIKAAFPGGSITGAPKIRSMEIIDELEPTQRNIYTGALGYLGFNGNVDLNIVIRTIIAKENIAYFQVGSGIVWDSIPENEYEETLHKARALFKSLDTEFK